MEWNDLGGRVESPTAGLALSDHEMRTQKPSDVADL